MPPGPREEGWGARGGVERGALAQSPQTSLCVSGPTFSGWLGPGVGYSAFLCGGVTGSVQVHPTPVALSLKYRAQRWSVLPR